MSDLEMAKQILELRRDVSVHEARNYVDAIWDYFATHMDEEMIPDSFIDDYEKLDEYQKEHAFFYACGIIWGMMEPTSGDPGYVA